MVEYGWGFMIFEWWMCYIWGWKLWAQACSCYRCHLGFASSVQPYPHLTLPSPSLDVRACPSITVYIHLQCPLAQCTVSLSLDGPALITEHVLLPFTLFKLVWRMVWKRLLGFRKMSQVKKLPISCIVFEKIISKKDLNTSKVLLLAPDQRVISGFQIRKVDLEQPIDHL